MGLYDSIDLDFSWEGDFSTGEDGDIKDTSEDFLLSLENEVRDIVKASFGDWEKEPNLGADLSDFKGEPNTRTNAVRIKERVESKLAQSGVVQGQDVAVRVVPVNIHQALIAIKIDAVATPGNRLQTGEPIIISVVYDSSEDSIFFLPPSEIELGAL